MSGALLLLLACGGGAPEPAPSEGAADAVEQAREAPGITDYRAHAAEVVGLLKAGEVEAVAGRFHVAEDAAADQVAFEREGLMTSLGVIEQRLGRVMLARPTDGQATRSYDLRLTSMDGDWWAANAGSQPAAIAYFDAEFIKGGSGVIRVGYFKVGRRVVMQGLVIGLDATAEGRQLALEALREMMVKRGALDGPDLLEQLEKSIPPPP